MPPRYNRGKLRAYRRKQSDRTLRYRSRRVGKSRRGTGGRIGSRRVRQTGRKAKPVRSVISQFLAAQLDPFDERSYGVRVPDDNTAPSSAFNTYDEYPLPLDGTNPTFAVCWAFFPNPTMNLVPSTAAAAASWTWPATFGSASATGKLSAIVAQYQVIRPVSHGIKVSSGLNPTSVTGFAHFALYAMSTFGKTTYALPTTIAQLADCPWYKRVPLATLTQNPMIVCNKFLDQTAFRYIDAASSEQINAIKGTFQIPNQWMVLLVAVSACSSAASTVAMVAEDLVHYEGCSIYTGLQMDQPAAMPSASTIEHTARVSGRTDASFTQAEQGSRISAALASASPTGTYLGDVASRVVDRYAPAAASAVYNAAVDFSVGVLSQAVENSISAVSGVPKRPRLQY